MDVILNETIDARPTDCHPLPNVSHYYQRILTCLGYPEDAPPVGDLLRRYHGLEGSWCVVSPVHWQTTHNDAMIVACDDALGLSSSESLRYFEQWASYLQEEGIALHYHDAYTWLIQTDNRPEPCALPVHRILNCSITPHLKQLDSASYWPRILTENQILWHSNAQHDGSLNGVWIWGAGYLASPSTRLMVCGDEASYRLARLLSTTVHRFDDEHAASSMPKSDDMIVLSMRDVPFQHKTTRWYWNNSAYQTKASFGLQRCWHSLRNWIT